MSVVSTLCLPSVPESISEGVYFRCQGNFPTCDVCSCDQSLGRERRKRVHAGGCGGQSQTSEPDCWGLGQAKDCWADAGRVAVLVATGVPECKEFEHFDTDDLVGFNVVEHDAGRDLFGLDNRRIVKMEVEGAGLLVDASLQLFVDLCWADESLTWIAPLIVGPCFVVGRIVGIQLIGPIVLCRFVGPVVGVLLVGAVVQVALVSL